MGAHTRIVFLLAVSAWAAPRGTLTVRIFDMDGRTIVPARVNVMGADHAFYEPDPARNPLAEYSLARKGNRANVGPLRYYGSFFYTGGSFQLDLPPGPAGVEVQKGFDYYRYTGRVRIDSGKASRCDVTLRRVVDMPRHGWHSTDPHLHFDRSSTAIDHTIAQLLAAEDVELGHILTHESARGWGAASVYSEGGYSMRSGTEFTTSTLGHVNLLMIDRAAAAATPLAALYDRALAAHGAMQHDHAGYGEEIYADAAVGKSDWVELLQFGLYRPQIGLEGYYLLLNSGLRYPLAGGSDYPVCRTMSDSRTYVADAPATGFARAVGRMLRGESFATSGPLLFLSVNGKGPGSDIDLTAPAEADVRVKALSGDLPFRSLEIIRDGKVAAEWHGAPVFEKELHAALPLNAASWIAARCAGPHTVHAHTNPVWVRFGGRMPFQDGAARELLRRIRVFEGAKGISARAAAVMEEAIAAGRTPRAAGPDGRFPVPPAGAVLFPPLQPRPQAPAPVFLKGTVTDRRGRPLSGVTVSTGDGAVQTRTDAAGRFRLAGIHPAAPLFLRASLSPYVTTNTGYLNPWAIEPVRIVLLTGQEAKDMAPAPSPSDAILVVGGAATDPRIAQQNAPAFTRHGKDFAAALPIHYQPAEPPEPDGIAPNVIVASDRLRKTVVLPAFAGQVTWAVIGE